jgi:hypothetical protein
MVTAMAFTSQTGLTTSGGALIGGVCLLGFGVGRGMSRASVSTLAFALRW